MTCNIRKKSSGVDKADKKSIEILYNYSDKDKVELYTLAKEISSITTATDSAKLSGTSVSSAISAAIAASLWSTEKTRNAREIRGLLTYSAYDYQGTAILNPNQAQVECQHFF